MKKSKLLIIFSMLLVCFSMSKINASDYKKFSLDDYIFYDPVHDSNCSMDDYWTIFNKDTTCYRFFVIDSNDSKEKDKISAILDHDIGNDTFDNRYKVLEKNTSDWYFRGVKRFITQNEIKTLYRFNKLSSDEKNGSYLDYSGNVVSVGAYHSTIGQMITNSLYYNNSKMYNNNGFWTDSSYDDKYSYSIDELGNSKLVKKIFKRGIRPVLEFDKENIESSKLRTNIDIVEKYKYKSDTSSYGGYVYKTMQGFTMTNDRLVFYSSNNSNPNFGLIFGFEGEDYSRKVGNTPNYYEGGHGNSISYDRKNNQVLSLDPYNKRIAVFDNFDLTLKGYIKMKKSSYDSIAYDYDHNYFILGEGRKLSIADKSFNILYTLDATTYGINQGLEYYNGYLYKPVYYAKCFNKYQTHCTTGAYKGDIYVYNIKINSNGRANKNFGKLEKIYHIFNNSYGELEDLSFFKDDLYLGFNSNKKDKNYAYKIYFIDGKEVIPELKIDKKYKFDDKSIYITLSSGDELKEIKGWEKIDRYSYKKKYSINSNNDKVKVCDLYNNCTDVVIDFNEIKSNVSDIVIDKENITIDVNDSELLHYSVIPSTSIDKSVIWSSSNNDVAYVDETGLVIGLSEGKAVVSAESGDGKIKKYINIKVNGSRSGIHFDEDILYIKPGDFHKIKYSLYLNEKVSNKLIWSSSNSDIASISEDGTIKGLKEGMTTISVSTSDGLETNKCNVIVTNNMEKIEFVDSSINIGIKESKKIDYYISSNNRKISDLIWSSSNDKVLKVDKDGVITGVSKGVAQITVSNKDKTVYNTAIIIVNGSSNIGIVKLLKIVGIILSIGTYVGIYLIIRKHYKK